MTVPYKIFSYKDHKRKIIMGVLITFLHTVTPPLAPSSKIQKEIIMQLTFSAERLCFDVFDLIS
jgi:hypothetical protein